MTKHSRRTFLKQAAGAAAACSILSRSARADVNGQIRMAVVGFNGRGRSHIDGFQDQLVALCDCDAAVLGKTAEAFEKKHGRKLDKIADFRRLLDRKDIDAISIATPNHTHSLIAILAAQAGKDVYVEKPISQRVWEGRQLANAAAHYKRMIQCGTQGRSCPSIRQAVDYVHSGKLGRVQYIVGTCYKPRPSIGRSDTPLVIPKQLDYELWCGPAAKKDIYRPKRNSMGGYNPHYDWHWDFNTGCGDMGNQGIHQMDIARWFLGASALSPRVVSFGGRVGYQDAGNTPNTQVVLHDYPEAPILFETRGLPKSKAAQQNWGNSMDTYRGSQVGVVVQCEHGYVVSTAKYDEVKVFPDGGEVITFHGGAEHLHFQNFLAAVRSRKRSDLHADVLDGHLSSACATRGTFRTNWVSRNRQRTSWHQPETTTGSATRWSGCSPTCGPMKWISISRYLRRARGSRWTRRERFTNNAAANELLRREDRKPFVVPEIA